MFHSFICSLIPTVIVIVLLVSRIVIAIIIIIIIIIIVIIIIIIILLIIMASFMASMVTMAPCRQQQQQRQEEPYFNTHLVADIAYEFEVLGSVLILTRGTVNHDNNPQRLNKRQFYALGCNSKQCVQA